MKLFTILIAATLLCSCNLLYNAQDKKAARKENKKLQEAKQQFQLKKDSFASIVAEEFPCIPKHIVDTTISINDTAYQRSMLELIADLTYNLDSLSSVQGIPSTYYSWDGKEITQKQFFDELIHRVQNIKPVIKEIPKPYAVEDSAALNQLRNQVQAANLERSSAVNLSTSLLNDNSALVDNRNAWRTRCYITWGALLLLLIGFIIAKIYGKK